MRKALKFFICVLVLVFGLNNFIYAQKTDVANKDEDLAIMQLDDVQIEAQSVRNLISSLSLSYNIPIGLEIAVNDNEFAMYEIDFKKGTLTDLLTQFVNQHNEYMWEIKDGVVNIFPKDGYRDSLFRVLLETNINSFSVREKTSCWNFEKSLGDAPEIKKILEDNGLIYSGSGIGGFYIQQLGRQFTFDASNMTMKAILNRVAKESPIAKFWSVKKYNDDQRLRLDVNSRHEDHPMKNGKPVLFKFPKISTLE